MTRPASEGRWQRPHVNIEWGESIKDLGRRVYVDIWGRATQGPLWRFQLRVVATPSRWRPPHDFRVEVRLSHNRWVGLDFTIGGRRYR